MCSVQWQCAVFSVRCNVCSVQCALCSVLSAVCTVQCTMCNVVSVCTVKMQCTLKCNVVVVISERATTYMTGMTNFSDPTLFRDHWKKLGTSPIQLTLGCTLLHCTVPNCTLLWFTALHWSSLHWSSLHCTVPHCDSLHCADRSDHCPLTTRINSCRRYEWDPRHTYCCTPPYNNSCFPNFEITISS